MLEDRSVTFNFSQVGDTISQKDGPICTNSRRKELHLPLLVLWVRFAVDEPPAAPLHEVTVPAALLDDALGLEPQSGLQAGAEGGRGCCAGLRACARCNCGARGTQQECGECAGGRCATTQT